MAYPHTHLSGLEVSTKIIRNGSDIGYLFRNKYYDFNFQNNYLLNPSVEITQVCYSSLKFAYAKDGSLRYTYE